MGSYQKQLQTPSFPLFSCGKTYITYGYQCPQYGGNHYGADCIPYPAYTSSACDVVAVSDGVVIYTKDTVNKTLDLNIKSNWQHPDALGNNIKIKHNNGMITRYCHLAYGSIKVKVGDKVKQGQIIGVMGTTGLSSGKHVHFEVWCNNSSISRVDPEPYLLGESLLYKKTKVKYVYKATDNTHLYSAPSATSATVGDVAVNDYIPCDYYITVSGKKWLHTLSNGWILATACKKRLITPYTLKNTTDYLNVRSSPSTTSLSVGLLGSDDTVAVVGGSTKKEGRNWCKVCYNGRLCWVCSDYLK